MKESDPRKRDSPSRLIDAKIEEPGDWRGETLSRIRTLIKQADPEVVEEWKWSITALFCLRIGFTAYAQLRLPQVAEAFTHLEATTLSAEAARLAEGRAIGETLFVHARHRRPFTSAVPPATSSMPPRDPGTPARSRAG